MSKSIRIRTTPNGDDKYIKVELNQDFDLLEILSLKIKQADVYQNFCSDYGVVAGRIVVNNGYGVPNVKVSIFVPILSEDIDNPIINQLYPYESPGEQEKNVSGIRYNLLPNTQQTFDHTPVGTFAEKKEILDSEVTLEIYEKYYKYTTTTNHAGDFILFGVPTGEQLLHYDMDISDIGFLSARPYEMVEQGYPKELFESPFKFKRQRNISSLPQIINENIPVLVEPFWCDDLSTGRIVGITRQDIALEPYNLIPTATFFGSVFSDDEKDSINKNCRPRRKTGKLNEVISGGGKIECIRRSDNGNIETFKLSDEDIDENGNWAIQLPMNLRKVITSEFGDLIPSPDGIVGISTEADVRFRITMDKTSNDKRLRQRGSYLVPNMTGNYKFGDYTAKEVRDNSIFKINKQLSTYTTSTTYSGDTSNIYNYLEEFYTFRWKKVYTIRQFIGRYQKYKNDEKRTFVGIKDILSGEGVNKFPNNRFDTHVNPLYSLLCFLLMVFGYMIALVNSIIQIINGLITMLCQIKVPFGFRIRVNYCICIGFPTVRFKTITLAGIVIIPGFILIPGFTLACVCNKRACCTEDCEAKDGDCTDAECGDPKSNGKCDDKCCKCCHSTWIKVVLYVKYLCIVAPLLCKKCRSQCPDLYPEGHSCCRCPCTNESKCKCPGSTECCNCNPNDYNNPPTTIGCCDNCHGCPRNRGFWVLVIDGDEDEDSGAPDAEDDEKCCNQCCVKIPLIGLKCPEDANFPKMTPTIIGTPFAAAVCNDTRIQGLCLSCGGSFTPMIGPWVACKLEGIAAWLNMLKFDFYNDWVNGTLYFPLIKRKYKVKKRKKKFGQIKKDKFCDFDCDEFQGSGGDEYSIRLIYQSSGSKTYTHNGCKFKLSGYVPYLSDWVLDPGGAPLLAQAGCWSQLAEMIGGTDSVTGAYCKPDLNGITTAQWAAQGITVDIKNRQVPDPHEKPDYISTKDPVTGIDTQVNVGGHSHHRNKCNDTYRHEKYDFLQEVMGCPKDAKVAATGCDEFEDGSGIVIDSDVEDEDDSSAFDVLSPCDTSAENQCALGGDCAWGAGACTGLCLPGTPTLQGLDCSCLDCNCPHWYGDDRIAHGIAKWEEGIIYYPSVITHDDDSWNPEPKYLKGNLLFPTNICEVGSSVFCDIDDTPFVMDQLVPTTFQVSEEGEKFRLGGGPCEIKKIEDKGDAGVNLRAYVDFGCVAAHCVNPNATALQSQLGVDMIDQNNVGLELGACKLQFEHDEEIREYFCQRFSTYKNNNLEVHYQRPGGHEFENYYATYALNYPLGWEGPVPAANPPPCSPSGTYGQDYIFVPDLAQNVPQPGGGNVNDGDPFIPGDRCGLIQDKFKVTNFYGIDIPNADKMSQNFIPTDEYEEEDLGGPPAGTPPPPGWDTDWGVNHGSSHTPYFFYFGIVPGKTALHKVVSKYFADKIDKTTLAGLPGSQNASQNINNQTNYRNSIKNPFSILKSCLGERLTINKQE